MGFFSFISKLFSGGSVEQSELDAARERHGVTMTPDEKKEADKDITEIQRAYEDYDAWEELKHYRTNFFFGSWMTKKFHVIGEAKIKRELEELAKKREEQALKKQQKEKGKGEG